MNNDKLIEAVSKIADILESLLEPEKEERKPLFTFEGHDYFYGDKCFRFHKRDYMIQKIEADQFILLHREGQFVSKIYPTKELCKEALNTYIWENHKVSEKERKEISFQYGIEKGAWDWKKFYCGTIIKQKNNG